jgi:hypothetical protein
MVVGCLSYWVQTCDLNGVLHHALRSICNGNEKEAKSAYGIYPSLSLTLSLEIYKLPSHVVELFL